MVRKTILFIASLLLVSGGFASAKNTAAKTPATPAKSLSQEVQELKEQMEELKKVRATHDEFGFVVTSPYVGIRATYDAEDLLANLPFINDDLKLLQQKQEIAEYTAAHQIKIPDRPMISLSGLLEGQGNWTRDFTCGAKSDIDLSRIELDVLGEINSWVTSFITLAYDDDIPVTGARVTNSRIYLDQGFITMGNFNRSPIYGTLGQIYVPFGVYDNYMVTVPLTQSLARTKERAVVLGYNDNSLGLYGSVYGYKGETYVSDLNNIINGWGANFGYTTKWRDIDMGFGIGYINNIAESEGMQDTDGTTFQGFGINNNEKFAHFVPAVDLHALLDYGNFSLVGEYITTTRSFDQTSNMSFNNHGAAPKALDVEANYNFKLMNKLSAFTLGYGRTWESLALNLPKHSAIAKFGMALWNSTIESIEYRHDWNYSKSDTASGGNDGEIFSPTGAKTRNIVTLFVGVYF